MTTKTKYIIVGVALLASFAAGRWATPTKVVVETKTVEVEKKSEKTDTDLNRDKHKQTTTVEETAPDGTKKTTTTVTEDSQTHKVTQDTQNDTTTTNTDSTGSTTYSSAKVTVSALAGIPIGLHPVPTFGVSVSKPILGPITVGVFGFTNGLVGASVGLTF